MQVGPKATLLNLADPVKPSVTCEIAFLLEWALEPIRLTFFLKCPIGGESPLTPKATETEAI